MRMSTLLESVEMNDEHFMHIAIEEAQKAEAKNEVPVGVVVTDSEGCILSRAHNQIITNCDPTAHAEILALREACASMRNYRLLSTTLYATVEPCVMCMGAIVHARVKRVVFGAHDPKWGAAGSLYNFSEDNLLNHHTEIVGGVCAERCRSMMQHFFRSRRKLRPNTEQKS